MKALFFSPFAWIVQHSVPEATVARELKKAGYRLEYITCGKIFAGQCTVRESIPNSKDWAPEKIEEICKECTRCSRNLMPTAKSLAAWLDSADFDYETKTRELLETVDRHNIIDFTFEGVPFGRLAAYQHLISFKMFSTEIAESVWPIFRQELKNCLLTYFALKARDRLERDKPDHVFIYNTLYGVNAVVRYFFENQSVSVICLHAGSNLRHFHDTLVMARGDTFRHIKSLVAGWPAHKKTPVSPAEGAWVAAHFTELSQGRSAFAYSSPSSKNVFCSRSRWSIPDTSKIILVAMSSYDERFAAEYVGVLAPSKESIYPSQIDWLIDLVDFAQKRPDYFFIIRLHPREFPNKRDSQFSQHAQLVLNTLKNLPANVVLNTPADAISIYDLARDLDLLLTSWSSVAKEMLLLGAPVVLFAADIQWYPTDFVFVGHTRKEYFELIDRAVTEGWSFQRSKMMFRWFAFESNRTAFKLTTRLSYATPKWRQFPWRVLNKVKPGYLVNLRVGRVRENQQLIKFLKSADRFPAPDEEVHSKHPTSATEENSVLRASLSLVAQSFWGDSSNWPGRFKKVLELRTGQGSDFRNP